MSVNETISAVTEKIIATKVARGIKWADVAAKVPTGPVAGRRGDGCLLRRGRHLLAR